MENNLKNIPDSELLKELEQRGYVTAFLLSTEDVDINLESINYDRETAGTEQITLTEQDKIDILESIVDTHSEYIGQQLNEAIELLIVEDYSE